MFILIILLWIISPLILIPLSIYLYNKSKKSERFINELYSSGRINEIERNNMSTFTQPMNTPPMPPNIPPMPPYAPMPHFQPNFRAESAPVMQSAPLPQYMASNVAPTPSVNSSDSPVVSDSKSISSISVILMVGVVFVVLAGIIFAKTSWGILNDISRILTLTSFGAVFFCVSAVSHKKFNLMRTGAAFFALGSIFLPVSVATSGYLGLFGNYFAPSGEGGILPYTAAFLVLSVACYIGTMFYNTKSYAILFLSSITLFIETFMLYAFNYDAASLFMSIYALILIIFSKRIRSLNSPFSTVIIPFALVCCFFLSYLTLPKATILSGVSSLIFALIFFMPIFTEKLGRISTVPVTVFLVLGVFRCFETLQDTLLVSLATVSAVLMIIGSIVKLDNEISKVYRIYAVLGFGLHALTALTLAFSDSCENVLQPISTLVIFIAIFFCADIKKSKLLYSCLPIQLILCLIQFTFHFFDDSFDIGIIILLYTLIGAFVTFSLIKRMRTAFSDIIFLSILPIVGFYCSFVNAFSNESITKALCIGAISLIPIFAVFVIMRKDFNPVSSTITALCYPILIFGIVFSLLMLLNNVTDDIANILYLTILSLSIPVFSSKPYFTHRLVAILSSAAVVCIASLAFSYVSFLTYISTLIAAFVSIYLFYFFQKQNTKTSAVISFFAFEIYLLITIARIVIEYNKSESLSFSLWALLLLISAYVYTYFMNSKASVAFDSLKIFVLTSLPIFSFVFSIYLSIFGDYKSEILNVLLCITVCLTAFFQSKHIFSTAIGGISFYVTISAIIEILNFRNGLIYLFMCSIFTVFVVLSTYGKRFFSQKLSSDFRLMTIGVPIMMFSDNSFFNYKLAEYSIFIALLLASAIPLLYCDFKKKTQKQNLLLSLAVCIFALALILQPIDINSDFLDDKYYLIPILLASIVIKHIWEKGSFAHKNALFIVGLWSVISLSLSAIASQLLSDALFILSIALIMLVASFMCRQKKWFLLSTVTLCTLSIYLSNKLDLQIGWWVYLLTAGVILIGVAASNEYLKTKGESLKEKAGRFWQEWTW